MIVVYLICLIVTSSATAMHLPSNNSATKSTQKTLKDLIVTLSNLQVWREGFVNSVANTKPNSFASKQPSYPPLSINPDLVPALFASEWAYPQSTKNQR